MSFDIGCPGKAYVLSNVNHIALGDHYWVFANRIVEPGPPREPRTDTRWGELERSRAEARRV
ncbi:hypothetical protein F2Q70_00003679 [Brassica cretica]|uniref:Uncharacterized protein n=1 Tax=Brassica cretica TaxID=69181 RepID=A0A8S9IPT4_BRACR|nr:hypothetical protein F2Q70_00003679 [Brassica cretica]